MNEDTECHAVNPTWRKVGDFQILKKGKFEKLDMYESW